jgi:hypothetical protein
MKPVLILLSFAFMLCSCGQKKTPVQKPDTVAVKPVELKTDSTNDGTTLLIADTTKMLLKYNVDRPFSEIERNDHFKIALYGENMLKGVVIFEILNNKNESIFKEMFTADELLGDRIDNLTLTQKADTIKHRMALFFSEDSFTKPAIDSTERYENSAYYDIPGIPSKTDWDAVKADKTTIGFYYSHGYESTYGIAFSKKRGKVIQVFYSD